MWSVPVATEDQMLTTHPATRHTNELCDVQTTNNYFSRNLIFLAVDGGNKTRLQCNVCYLMLGKGGGGRRRVVGGGSHPISPGRQTIRNYDNKTVLTQTLPSLHPQSVFYILYFVLPLSQTNNENCGDELRISMLFFTNSNIDPTTCIEIT